MSTDAEYATHYEKARAEWLATTRRQKARLLWDVYLSQYGWVAVALPVLGAFMLATAAFQWSRGLPDLAWAYGIVALADVILVWTQVDLSASRVTVQEAYQQLDELDEKLQRREALIQAQDGAITALKEHIVSISPYDEQTAPERMEKPDGA